VAAGGQVDEALLARLLEHPFSHDRFPKSLVDSTSAQTSWRVVESSKTARPRLPLSARQRWDAGSICLPARPA
jgi:1,6-anhydro-N-acetylmuramate kinase